MPGNKDFDELAVFRSGLADCPSIHLAQTQKPTNGNFVVFPLQFVLGGKEVFLANFYGGRQRHNDSPYFFIREYPTASTLR